MKKHTPTHKIASNKRNSLGMDQAVYEQLLKKLNHEHEHMGHPTSPSRIHTRLEYHEPYLELEFETQDRSKRTLTVAARNISRGGLSVLHSSYTYPGTRIRTYLNRIDGKAHLAIGTAVRCDHRGGVVHEIGIRFDLPIIVQEFIRPDIMQSVRTHERVEPTMLNRTLLVVGHDQSIIPIVRQYLTQTSVKYAFADSVEEAQKRNPHEHDMILCCLDATDMTGPEFARIMRDKGYSKPILLTGSCIDESTRHQIRLSLADAFVPSPVDENDLLCALGEYMLTEWDEKILDTIRKHNSAQTSDALRAELAKRAIVLDQNIRTQDPVQIYATCNKIRSLAPLLGLKTLRESAQRVAESIAANGDIASLTEDLAQIKSMCIDRASAA